MGFARQHSRARVTKRDMSTSAKSWPKYAFLAAVLIGGALFIRAQRPPPPPPPQSGVPRLSSFLGIHPGDKVGDFTVERIEPEGNDGAASLKIELTRDGAGLALYVARRGKMQLPPLTTAQFDVAYGGAFGKKLEPTDSPAKVAAQFVDLVKQREGSATDTAGL